MIQVFFVKVQIPKLYLIYVNAQLNNISNWMKANKQILNIEKTNYILFGTQATIENNLKLYYRNKEINIVSNTKFLGVFVDEKLSWNNHIDNLCKTLSKNIGILYRLQFLPQNVSKMLYHSLVSSHVNYCNIVWGFTTKKNIERIHKLQKRGIRIITHSPFVSSSVPLFLKMKSLPVSDLVSLQTALFMFRLRNNLLPEVFNHCFTLNCSIHNYKSRNAQNIHPPLNRILITQSSIFF